MKDQFLEKANKLKSELLITNRKALKTTKIKCDLCNRTTKLTYAAKHRKCKTHIERLKKVKKVRDCIAELS
jgi:hypothetical protein